MEEMNQPHRPSVCIIGAGNVATHLALALASVAEVSQVVSRHMDSARKLGERIGERCVASDNLGDLLPGCDFYIISVNDDAVEGVVDATPDLPGIWAHTSGCVPADVFRGKKSRYGVFYPLQTFTRDVDVNVKEVPFFIEGSDRDSEEKLVLLAGGISPVVRIADSMRRKSLHVAAVFACNFANLMWMEADDILHDEGLDVSCFMPLLSATLGKLRKVSPRDAMTGPARRGDTDVIRSHLELLPPEKREIYQLLSQRILKAFSNE